ncbi:MAG TPA: DUF2238 domain-containing protein [Candidatus Nanoarchaeia archaeon]|nr:DUF2238 domain-containing protein [Candidatus Nanoarchaeia archaeon]
MNKKFWKKYPVYLFWFYVAVWILLAINVVDRFTWFLENIVIFIFVPIIILVHRKMKFSNWTCTLITVYLIIHTIGAHYTYSQTPFFSYFGSHKFQRDNYDRVTHFTFGFILYYPVREFIMKISAQRKFLSYYIPWAIIVSFSALYEIWEWMTAVIFSPQRVEAFMGIQGDIFDTQKDMMLAVIGATIAAFMIFLKNIKNNKALAKK